VRFRATDQSAITPYHSHDNNNWPRLETLIDNSTTTPGQSVASDSDQSAAPIFVRTLHISILLRLSAPAAHFPPTQK
jgi:hypothetical protein